MKKLLLTLTGVFLLACGMPAYAAGGVFSDTGFSVSGDTSFFSKYVWRGFALDTDTVMQPGLYLSTPKSDLGVVKLSFWGNEDIGTGDDLASDEADYVIDYTFSLEKVSFSIGHTYYDFVGSDLRSKEYYGAIALALPLSPSLYIYKDYGDEEDGGGDGMYYVLNLACSIPLASTSLDLAGHVGYNKDLFIEGEGVDALIGAGLTVPLTSALSMKPNINYSMPFGDLEDENHGNQDEEFFGGLTLSYTF